MLPTAQEVYLVLPTAVLTITAAVAAVVATAILVAAEVLVLLAVAAMATIAVLDLIRVSNSVLRHKVEPVLDPLQVKAVVLVLDLWQLVEVVQGHLELKWKVEVILMALVQMLELVKEVQEVEV